MYTQQDSIFNDFNSKKISDIDLFFYEILNQKLLMYNIINIFKKRSKTSQVDRVINEEDSQRVGEKSNLF